MTSWTHLIRFIAVEDHHIHIGQLVDTTRDVGLDSFEGKIIKAYEIIGTIFNGSVTKTQLTVLQVSRRWETGKYLGAAVFQRIDFLYSYFHQSTVVTAHSSAV